MEAFSETQVTDHKDQSTQKGVKMGILSQGSREQSSLTTIQSAIHLFHLSI